MTKKICMILCICLSFLSVVAAAPREEDFSCHGLYLGDGYEQMIKQLGQPRYDFEQLVQGALVKYYMYPDDLKVGLLSRDGKVVDIQIVSKKYEARDGVKIGATPYKIQQVYGKNEKKFIAGKACYLYIREGKTSDKLFLEVDAVDGYLEKFHLTSLPTGDARVDEVDDEAANGDDVDSLYIRTKDIDMSALPSK